MNLRNKAMLVSVSISQWTARKYDKEASRKTAELYNTSVNAGRYNKVLIAEDEIKKISKIANEARTYVCNNTLAWGRRGENLLPSAHYFDFLRELGEIKTRFNDAVQSFVAVYPDLKDDARIKLNGMFNETDYPPVSKINSKFNFEISFFPLPNGDDFRLSIGEEEGEQLKADLTEKIKSQFDEAAKDLWNRLFNVVQHMRDRLQNIGEPGTRFYDSNVSNIKDLCRLLPRLNIMNDPNLDNMRIEIERELTRYTSDELKTDETSAKETEKKADEILAKLKGFMS